MQPQEFDTLSPSTPVSQGIDHQICLIMKRTSTYQVLIYSVLLFVAGCQSIVARDHIYRLNETLRLYEKSVRWNFFDEAYTFLKPEFADDARHHEDAENIKITSYEVISPPEQTDDFHAVQTVVVEFVYLDEQVVRKVIDQQLWEYSKESGGWMRANPIPEFR